MIIDIHAHIWGKTPEGLEKSKDLLRGAAKDFGIDRIYVSGLCNKISDEAEIDYLNDEVYKFMK